MSTRRKLTRIKGARTPPPEALAYAEAYECGHCVAEVRLVHYPADPDEMWTLDIRHDAGCPVLAGHVPHAAAGQRAARLAALYLADDDP